MALLRVRAGVSGKRGRDVTAASPAVADRVAGARAVFDGLWERHHGAVYGYCCHLTDAHRGADLTQDVFLDAFRALLDGRFDGRNERAWLFTNATRKALDRRRLGWGRFVRGSLERLFPEYFRPQRRRRRPAPPGRGAPPRPPPGRGGGPHRARPHGASRSASAPSRRSGRRSAAAVRRLPPSHRAVLWLREWQAMDYDQISRVLGISRASTKAMLWRARARFREEWCEAGGPGVTGTGSLVVAVGARGAGQRFGPAPGPAGLSAKAAALGLRTRQDVDREFAAARQGWSGGTDYHCPFCDTGLLEPLRRPQAHADEGAPGPPLGLVRGGRQGRRGPPVSASAIDPLWIAFGAFGFGCAVVAFTVGCWVGRGVGRLEPDQTRGLARRRRPRPPTRHLRACPRGRGPAERRRPEAPVAACREERARGRGAAAEEDGRSGVAGRAGAVTRTGRDQHASEKGDQRHGTEHGTARDRRDRGPDAGRRAGHRAGRHRGRLRGAPRGHLRGGVPPVRGRAGGASTGRACAWCTASPRASTPARCWTSWPR